MNTQENEIIAMPDPVFNLIEFDKSLQRLPFVPKYLSEREEAYKQLKVERNEHLKIVYCLKVWVRWSGITHSMACSLAKFEVDALNVIYSKNEQIPLEYARYSWRKEVFGIPWDKTKIVFPN